MLIPGASARIRSCPLPHLWVWDCKSEDYISYARVLGFRKNATPLLTEIKKNSSIPLVTSLADARQTLSPESLRMLDLDILRNQIYLGNLALKNQTEMVNEYRTPIVIV